MKNLKSTLFTLLGAVALVAVAVTGTLFFTSPSGYLSIDVNPSVEFSFNRLNRVVEANGLNPEAVALLDGKDFKGLEIDDAVREVVFSLLDNGYLSHEEAMLMFSTDDKEASNEILQRIKNEAVVWLKEYYETTSLISQSVSLNEDEIKLAHELGMSAGKYNLVKNILSSGEDVSTSTLMNMTIGELMRFAQENQIALDMIDDGTRDDQDEQDGKDYMDEYVDPSSLIGSELAKEIAYLHAVVDPSMVFDLEVDLNEEDDRMIYEVEFKANDTKYEYDIDAVSGEIVKWERDDELDKQDDLDDQNESDDMNDDEQDQLDDLEDQDESDDRDDVNDDQDGQDQDQNDDSSDDMDDLNDDRDDDQNDDQDDDSNDDMNDDDDSDDHNNDDNDDDDNNNDSDDDNDDDNEDNDDD